MQTLQKIQETPRLSKSEICRCMNGKPYGYCSLRQCYANPRKRAKMLMLGLSLQRPVCRCSKANVWRITKKLENQGFLIVQKEKKQDHDNNRGWDWMQVSYTTGVIWFGRDDLA